MLKDLKSIKTTFKLLKGHKDFRTPNSVLKDYSIAASLKVTTPPCGSYQNCRACSPPRNTAHAVT